MALVIPQGFAQVAIEIRNQGDPDSWYVTYGTDFTVSSLGAVDTASNHAQAFADTWRAYLDTTSEVRGAQMTIGSDGGNYTIYGPVRSNGAGTSTAQRLPQNCATLIRKLTDRPGRAGKGRCFLPGMLAEASVDQVGVITSTAITLLQTNCDLWITNLATANAEEAYTMHVLHNAGIPGGTTPSPVVGLQPDGVIATQRRRLRR
uniref:Uncharacterized protein n=1 Tax=uncultured prokaryote TaxID=198431 RepID=A0A0H5Q8M3_9ZZZZ|nr:hypothetical protein [uncultured prokaryote]